jgi:two-component system cell cycle response regulator
MAQRTDDGGQALPGERGPRERGPMSATKRGALQQLLLEVAISDPQLNCFNRAYFVHRARGEIARRARYGARLSLLLLEPDHPEDSRHPAEEAEAALPHVANVARGSLRPSDLLARWRGNGLVVLLPCTGLAGATKLARRLAAAVRRDASAPGGVGPASISVSIGIATWLGREETLETLVRRARAGLLEAQERGRGGVGIG